MTYLSNRLRPRGSSWSETEWPFTKQMGQIGGVNFLTFFNWSLPLGDTGPRRTPDTPFGAGGQGAQVGVNLMGLS